MDRRDFMKASLATMGGALLESCKHDNVVVSPTGFSASYNVPHTLPAGKLKVQYISPNIPAIQVPALEGQRYQDTVPDTLDIAERAKLCINALTSITDANADHEVYWLATFSQNPPVMVHNFNDWVQSVEGMMEALPLVRLASGSTQNNHVDLAWMQIQLKTIGPDGLMYVPLRGRPWSLTSVAVPYMQPVFKPDGRAIAINDPSVSQLASPMSSHRALSTMTVSYLRDQNPIWKSAIEKLIERLGDLAVYRENYAYFPSGSLVPGGRFSPSAAMPTGVMAGENSGRMIQGLAQYYRASGYEPALLLAGKLANYLCQQAQYYEADGAWIFSPQEKTWVKNSWDVERLVHGGHGHSHGISLLAVLEYGLAANDKQMIEFVRSGYEWAKANGSPSIGFFPEWFLPQYDRCETDTIADMLAMAVKMSAAGVADYWDDADRLTRNHFSESQLTTVDWVYSLADRSPRKQAAWNETGGHVPDRSVGAFAGWSTANDFNVASPQHPHSIQHCCTGNSARTMYYVWQHIMDCENERLRVNLLLNRASEWADLYSHIPHEGRVELKVKQPLRAVLVRVPEWVQSKHPEVIATSGERRIPFTWDGRYLNLGSAMRGELLTVTLPIQEHRVRETIGNVAYVLDFKGNTLVNIDPPGKNGPLYQRAQYRSSKAPTRRVDRFVAEQTINW
jgi:hypothetical protein